ncbi:phosphoribosylanthranilate isomerase [Rhodopirellula bahusiensis]|uniref:N-(5'-phosphoribosyl)anthranilate isomerase n=1 Tax=Rhodopirellula bahusiensis TaxID=2014065 RepID=A0A2G1WDM9_9BACT|nr:phosphoribosylanthranilate isomerase [Rhodopirellula bahusiensis]PHQ37155.1 N-(5'-phosphoribosyl)anthranilate isomerase [Rhodopirellula bahusiensis]
MRSVNDVRAVAEAGADAVGLNFYEPSVRSLNPDAAETLQINDAARDHGLTRVGLFVNHDSAFILRVAGSLQLDWIQLHGDEPVSLAKTLIANGKRVLRAVRLPRGKLEPGQIEFVIGEWNGVDVSLLLDADAGASFGGGGQSLDWPSIQAWSKNRGESAAAWVLAGGLNPENVHEAICVSGASSVDVASGVEQPKGQKNAEKIRQFVAAIGRGGAAR